MIRCAGRSEAALAPWPYVFVFIIFFIKRAERAERPASPIGPNQKSEALPPPPPCALLFRSPRPPKRPTLALTVRMKSAKGRTPSRSCTKTRAARLAALTLSVRLLP